MGAKLAMGTVPVVALIGDGSAQFTLPELAAGATAGLPVVVIVWNNSGYGEIKQGMVASNISPVGVDIPPPDFIAAARAMGCKAEKPDNLEALGVALQAAVQRTVPTLLELDQSLFISQPAGQWY